MLSKILQISLIVAVLGSMLGCGESSPGEAHLMSAVDQRKAIENNPSLPPAAKTEALNNIAMAEAARLKK